MAVEPRNLGRYPKPNEMALEARAQVEITIEQAERLDNAVHLLRNRMETDALRMGHFLWQINDLKAFILLGYDTFPSYTASLGFSQATAYRLKDMWETFHDLKGVTEADVAQIGINRVAKIMPLVKAAKRQAEAAKDRGEADRKLAQAAEWVDMAKCLSGGDLRKEIRRAMKLVPDAQLLEDLEYYSAKIGKLALQLPDASNPETTLVDIRTAAREALDQIRGRKTNTATGALPWEIHPNYEPATEDSET